MLRCLPTPTFEHRASGLQSTPLTLLKKQIATVLDKKRKPCRLKYLPAHEIFYFL